MERLTVRVSAELKESIDRGAEVRGVTQAAFVRLLLTEARFGVGTQMRALDPSVVPSWESTFPEGPTSVVPRGIDPSWPVEIRESLAADPMVSAQMRGVGFPSVPLDLTLEREAIRPIFTEEMLERARPRRRFVARIRGRRS